MNAKRREAILNSLHAGHRIRLQWNGANASGYLQHLLEGVPRLREAEAKELDKEGLLFLETGRAGSFGSYRLRTPQDDENAAKAVAEREAEAARQQQKHQEKCERVFRVWQLINVQKEFHLYQQMRDSDTFRFEHDGHDYEVREVSKSK